MDVAAALSDDSISSGDSTLTNEPVFSSYPAVPFRQVCICVVPCLSVVVVAAIGSMSIGLYREIAIAIQKDSGDSNGGNV